MRRGRLRLSSVGALAAAILIAASLAAETVKVGGTGGRRKAPMGVALALAVCKKIVERHHGNIWVESELGHGSTFHFTLPA
jgi:light-regulated signal transduction histidine kinase (bacteriophytochrome)